MTEDVIARMRDRIKRIRKVIDLAHDPKMIQLLEQMVAEAEADIRQLEAECGKS
jgi:predicted  nucleic acid-binding Zn-ribbon protein